MTIPAAPAGLRSPSSQGAVTPQAPPRAIPAARRRILWTIVAIAGLMVVVSAVWLVWLDLNPPSRAEVGRRLAAGDFSGTGSDYQVETWIPGSCTFIFCSRGGYVVTARADFDSNLMSTEHMEPSLIIDRGEGDVYEKDGSNWVARAEGIESPLDVWGGVLLFSREGRDYAGRTTQGVNFTAHADFWGRIDQLTLRGFDAKVRYEPQTISLPTSAQRKPARLSHVAGDKVAEGARTEVTIACLTGGISPDVLGIQVERGGAPQVYSFRAAAAAPDLAFEWRDANHNGRVDNGDKYSFVRPLHSDGVFVTDFRARAPVDEPHCRNTHSGPAPWLAFTILVLAAAGARRSRP